MLKSIYFVKTRWDAKLDETLVMYYLRENYVFY